MAKSFPKRSSFPEIGEGSFHPAPGLTLLLQAAKELEDPIPRDIPILPAAIIRRLLPPKSSTSPI